MLLPFTSAMNCSRSLFMPIISHSAKLIHEKRCRVVLAHMPLSAIMAIRLRLCSGDNASYTFSPGKGCGIFNSFARILAIPLLSHSWNPRYRMRSSIVRSDAPYWDKKRHRAFSESLLYTPTIGEYSRFFKKNGFSYLVFIQKFVILSANVRVFFDYCKHFCNLI